MRNALIIATVFASLPSIATAQIISGAASAVDGDSFDMSGARIRLFGIDAPEGRQTCRRDGSDWKCGEEATELLSSMIRSQEVTCESRDRDPYGRIVAQCTANGIDLGQVMIESGLAVALPQFTEAYVETEARARSLKAGIWSSDFQMPADYRAAHGQAPRVAAIGQSSPLRQAAPKALVPDPYKGGCKIKGNRNRKGQWIYHLPGMPYYEATRPEEIFCTEAQARTAGYRRAIVK